MYNTFYFYFRFNNYTHLTPSPTFVDSFDVVGFILSRDFIDAVIISLHFIYV